MNTQLTDFIEYFKSKMPKHDKEKAQKETINHFRMTKDRKIDDVISTVSTTNTINSYNRCYISIIRFSK